MSQPITIRIDPQTQAAFAAKTSGRGLITQNVAEELLRQFALHAPDSAVAFFANQSGSYPNFFAMLETKARGDVRAELGPELMIAQGVRDLMAKRT